MPWEKRRNRAYYYRKERVGRRVLSEYLGRGEYAECIARIEALDRRRKAFAREMERHEFQEMRKEVEVCDGLIDEVEKAIRALTRGWMLAHGYHLHKGQWRKKRDGTSE